LIFNPEGGGILQLYECGVALIATCTLSLMLMLEVAPHKTHVSLLPHPFHITGWEPVAENQAVLF